MVNGTKSNGLSWWEFCEVRKGKRRGVFFVKL